MNNKIILSSLIAGAVALSSSQSFSADAHEAKEKCYGIAKAGHNDCGNNSHSCAGLAEVDNDPSEFVYAEQASCAKMGGQIK